MNIKFDFLADDEKNKQGEEIKMLLIGVCVITFICISFLLCLCILFRKDILFKCRKHHHTQLHVDTIQLRRLPSLVSRGSEETIFDIEGERKTK